MTSVLMTFETPFCVFVREVDVCCVPGEAFDRAMATKLGEVCFDENYQANRQNTRRRIEYHPRPGSASAVGHWSLLSDAGWRER